MHQMIWKQIRGSEAETVWPSSVQASCNFHDEPAAGPMNLLIVEDNAEILRIAPHMANK
jgi:hypothetical protein